MNDPRRQISPIIRTKDTGATLYISDYYTAGNPTGASAANYISVIQILLRQTGPCMPTPGNPCKPGGSFSFLKKQQQRKATI